MSYIITKTDGGLLSTPTMVNGVLLDGTADTSTGLTLIGRNYTNYGQVQNDNFVKLLENFADPLPPSQSINATVLLQGQLWYDTVNQKLMVYDSEEFIPVSQRSVGSTAPTTTYTGDQWWDSTNNQLKVWTGSAWLLIGPAYSSVNGKGGVFVETVTDTNSVTHTVLNNYINGNLVSVTSYDPTFSTTESLYSSYFSTIEPGINLASTMFFNGTAANSVAVGGLVRSQLVRTDVDNAITGSLSLSGALSLNNANIGYNAGALVVNNFNNNSNVDFYVHGTSGNVNALHIDGSTGLVSVTGNAVSNNGVTTKSYVDSAVANAVAYATNLNNTTSYNSNTIGTELTGCIAVLTSSLNANIGTFQGQVTANLAATTTNLNSNIASMNANITGANVVISAIESILPYFAPANSPFLTGTVQVPDTTQTTTYATNLGPDNNPYALVLNASVTVNAGDNIKIINSGTLGTVANCHVLASVSNQPYAVVGIWQGAMPVYANGVVTSSNYYFIEINGTNESIYVTSAQYVGPTLNAINTGLILGNNSSIAATTRYVDITANILNNDYVNQINTLSSYVATNTNNGLALKANISGQTFTGAIYAPTPSAGKNDTTVATTAFVTGAISTAQSTGYSAAGGPGTGPKITISTSTPSGGNDGDIWLQVGN